MFVSLYMYIVQKRIKNNNVKYIFPPWYLIVSVLQYVLYRDLCIAICIVSWGRRIVTALGPTHYFEAKKYKRHNNSVGLKLEHVEALIKPNIII